MSDDKSTREAALRRQLRYEHDPRIGTPIYGLLPECIDPTLTEQAEGKPVCLYGLKGQGEHCSYTEWPPDPEFDRPDGADKKQTRKLIAEVRARRAGLDVADAHAVPCPYCRGPLLEPGPHNRMFRVPVPEWAGGLLGWVHRNCRAKG